MSLSLAEHHQPASEVGGGEALVPPHLTAEDLIGQYSASFPSPDSSFDEDRPQSRLTIIESPTPDDYDYYDEFSQFSLDSPDPDEDLCHSPSGPLLSSGHAHTCEECNKKFSSPGKLRQHEYSHTGETPFECKIPDCDKKFTSKFKLKRHILIHSQTKTFLCDVCHRAFRRKDHLRNHEKVHDPGKTIYTCTYDNCARTYNSVTSFRKHQAMHSAEEGQLDCKICKMMLSSQEELMTHLKVHAGSRTMKGSLDKKFVCGQCDKKFFTRKDLKRHSVVHTGNREFSCPHCTQRFGRKDHMTRHAKKTHANFYDSSERLERTRLISTPLPGEEEEELVVRPSRKERSVSDPGPPLLLSRELKVPSYSSKVEPLNEMAESTQQLHQLPNQQKVIEEFEKLVTQDTLDLVKVGEEVVASSVQQQQVTTVSSVPSETGFLSSLPSKRIIKASSVIEQQAGCRDRFVLNNGQYFTLSQHHQQPSNPISPPETNTKDVSDMQDEARDHPMQVKVQQATAANDMLKFLLKEERNGLFDNNLGEDVRAFKELLAEKESMDFNTFMNDISDEGNPPVLNNSNSKKKLFLNPPSPSLTEDSLLPKYLEESLIKLEPPSSPTSMDSTSEIAAGFPTSNAQFSPTLPPLATSHPFPVIQAKARAIYLRTQSQDSLTRTKNPVLPSIHAESTLVVPEPKVVKYPVTGQDNSVSLDFTEDQEDGLADLKGQLFLSEEYGQNIFQPWN